MAVYFLKPKKLYAVCGVAKGKEYWLVLLMNDGARACVTISHLIPMEKLTMFLKHRLVLGVACHLRFIHF